MFCATCGTRLSDSAKFCTSCGQGVAQGANDDAAPVTARGANPDSRHANGEPLPSSPSTPPQVAQADQDATSRAVAICALVIVGAFFLPWVKVFGAGISGYQLAQLGAEGNYAWIIPALAGLTLLVGASGSNNRAIGAITGVVPLAVLAYVFFKLTGNGSAAGRVAWEVIAHIADVGAYLTLISSVLIILSATQSATSSPPATRNAYRRAKEYEKEMFRRAEQVAQAQVAVPTAPRVDSEVASTTAPAPVRAPVPTETVPRMTNGGDQENLPSIAARRAMIAGAASAIAVLVVGGGAYYLQRQKMVAGGSTAQTAASPQHALDGNAAEAEKARRRKEFADAAAQQAAAVGNRVVAPTGSVGESYTYETIDHVEPKLSNVTTREIVAIGPFDVTMKFVNSKSGYSRLLTYDRDLGLMSTRYGTNEGVDYSPALKYFAFPLQSGDNWNSSSTETNIKTGKIRLHKLTARVEGYETVAVPAGNFRALKVVLESTVEDDTGINSGRDISWYVPEVRRTVRSELESRDATGKTGRRTVSLTAFSLR